MKYAEFIFILFMTSYKEILKKWAIIATDNRYKRAKKSYRRSVLGTAVMDAQTHLKFGAKMINQ